MDGLRVHLGWYTLILGVQALMGSDHLLVVVRKSGEAVLSRYISSE
jgi:hypothetical protein